MGLKICENIMYRRGSAERCARTLRGESSVTDIGIQHDGRIPGAPLTCLLKFLTSRAVDFVCRYLWNGCNPHYKAKVPPETGHYC